VASERSVDRAEAAGQTSDGSGAFQLYATQQFAEPYWPLGLCIAWVMERNEERAIATFVARLIGSGSVTLERWPEARSALQRGLAGGEVTASGLQGEVRVEIPPRDWIDLNIRQHGLYEEVWRATSKKNLSVYRIAKKQMLEQWPVQVTRQKDESEKLCLEALKTLMMAAPRKPTPKRELIKRSPTVSRRAFDRIFSQASKESGCLAWRRGGRRRRG
jgi:hypothetical protein